MKLWPLVVTGIIVFSYQQVIADDFKNAQRFDEGDVISADVLNEVLERIAAAQKTVATKDLVGSWSVKWRTCLNGGPGNCSSLNVGEGFSDSVDSLYRERLDNWEVSEDGDNTFSVEMKNYCTLSSAAYNNGSELVYYNLPCKARIAVLGDYVLFGYISSTGTGGSTESTQHDNFATLKKISPTRYQMTKFSSGSGSFLSLELDKLNIPPTGPERLQAEISSDSVKLSWTNGDPDASDITFSVRRRDISVAGTFNEIGTTTTTDFIDDTIVENTTYHYRIFAKNDDGLSLGSNVRSVKYAPVNAPLAPSALTVTAFSTYTKLEWQAGSDNADSYVIERRTGSAGPFDVIGTTGTTTSFSDVNIVPEVAYNYRVYALNEAGSSPNSTTVSITVPKDTDSEADDPVSSASGWIGL